MVMWVICFLNYNRIWCSKHNGHNEAWVIPQNVFKERSSELKTDTANNT